MTTERAMKKLVKRGLTPFLVVGLLAVPGAAFAHTTDAIAETGGSTTTLTLLGTPLTIEVVLDDGGNITEVILDPATGATETETGPHEVKFVFGDGMTTLEVEAEDDELEVKVETSTLSDLVGPGTWSADIFGT
ncbi:MAG: hypothetical protein ACE5KX_02390, partial [Acidimicrobiia bacterium]